MRIVFLQREIEFTAEFNGGASLRRRVTRSFYLHDVNGVIMELEINLQRGGAILEWSNDGVGDKSPRREGRFWNRVLIELEINLQGEVKASLDKNNLAFRRYFGF